MIGWLRALLQRIGGKQPCPDQSEPDRAERPEPRRIYERQDAAIERIARVYGVSAELIRQRVEDRDDHSERA
jgi:hypothetical protein